MFGRSKEPRADPIIAAVAQELEGSDPATVEVVAAIAGLLAATAYADRDWSEAEEAHLLSVLRSVQGISERGAHAITALVQQRRLDLSTTQAVRYARSLRERADRELRLQVLDMLVDIAASDGTIQLSEVTVLRNTAGALGLTQDDYNTAQARHRDKLSFL